MPNVNEVRDSGPDGSPTIAEMRVSQEKGNRGIGLNKQSFNEDQADFNMGIGAVETKDTVTPLEVNPLPWMP